MPAWAAGGHRDANRAVDWHGAVSSVTQAASRWDQADGNSWPAACVLLAARSICGIVARLQAGGAKLVRRPAAATARRAASPAVSEHAAPHAPAPVQPDECAARAGGPRARPRRSRVLPGGGMRSMRPLAPSSCCWSSGPACPPLQAPCSCQRAAASIGRGRPSPPHLDLLYQRRPKASGRGGGRRGRGDERLRRTRAQHGQMKGPAGVARPPPDRLGAHLQLMYML